MKNAKKFWNTQAKRFNNDAGDELTRCIELAHVHLNKNHNVLEFGCGTGISTDLLSEHVGAITGIDFSEEMIRYANERSKGKDNVQYMIADIHDNRMMSEQYDVIIALNILHLVPDVDDVLIRIVDILKPGGLLISSTPCIGEKGSLINKVIEILSRLGVLISVNPFTVEQLLEKFGTAHLTTVESIIMDKSSHSIYAVAKKLSRENDNIGGSVYD